MTRSRLKFKVNLTGNTTDIRNLKKKQKQKKRNAVAQLNHQFILQYFEKVSN